MPVGSVTGLLAGGVTLCGAGLAADTDLSSATGFPGLWSFLPQYMPPGNATTFPSGQPACNGTTVEKPVTNIPGAPPGLAVATSPNYMVVGSPLTLPPSAALYGLTDDPLVSWFFDLPDHCGGNQFGWAAAIDESRGMVAVGDPRAHFSGTVWLFAITTPQLLQNITTGARGARMGHALAADGGWLLVGAPYCAYETGKGENRRVVQPGGCVTFFQHDPESNKWIDDITFQGAPGTTPDSGFGWAVALSGEWAAVASADGRAVHTYRLVERPVVVPGAAPGQTPFPSALNSMASPPPSPSPSQSLPASLTASATATASTTPSSSGTGSTSATPSGSDSPSPASVSHSQYRTSSPTPSHSGTASHTASASTSASGTPSGTTSPTGSSSTSPSQSDTPTHSPTGSPSASPPSMSNTPSDSPTISITPTPSRSTSASPSLSTLFSPDTRPVGNVPSPTPSVLASAPACGSPHHIRWVKVWEWAGMVKPPVAHTGSRWGHSLALSPDGLLVIGDERWPTSPSARGGVFTYRWAGGAWRAVAAYTDSEDSFNTHFGASVAVNDAYISVGVPGKAPQGGCTIIERDKAWCRGCDGQWGSSLRIDVCGVCGGNSTSCMGCDGIPHSNATLDGCGVCKGVNDTCIRFTTRVYPVECNRAVPLRTVGVQLDVGPPAANKSLNFTVLSPPTAGEWALNTSSGLLEWTPPLLFRGVAGMRIRVCRVDVPAVIPPGCTSPGVVLGTSRRYCKGYAPPRGGGTVCTNATLALHVENCKDCTGVEGGHTEVDGCGVCGGNNSTCAGCDGVPGTNTTVDFCGVCRGTNTTCLNVFPAAFLPGPCDPYIITLRHEPAAMGVTWTLVRKPLYGKATVAPYVGMLSYTAPPSLEGLPPWDEVTVQAVDHKWRNTDTKPIHIPFRLFHKNACGQCGPARPGAEDACVGCDGVPNSGRVVDKCGVCGGDGSSCDPRAFKSSSVMVSSFFLAVTVVTGAVAAGLAWMAHETLWRVRARRPLEGVGGNPANKRAH